MTPSLPSPASSPALGYTKGELLAVISSRFLAGRSMVFAGHGLPTLAVALAQQTIAPDLEMVYECGVVGARPNDLPLSISDSILVPGSAGVMPMTMLFNYVLQGRRIEVGFLGAAQIDKFGSLNSTLIGDTWKAPRVKLPGSGGAIEVMAGAREVFVVMRRHGPSTYVESLDFRTTPSPHAARTAAHGAMPQGLGVTHVISELGVLARSQPGDELRLSALQPGVSIDQVREATGWQLQVAPSLHTLPAPSTDELNRLRQLDPGRHYLR